MRIFTNQVATANALRRADARARAVAWNDPLAFGRLAAGNDLDAFAASRAIAYAGANWDEDNLVEEDLKLRNAELVEAFSSGDEVSLLFGGSLTDQLQLCQILAWLCGREPQEQAQVRLMQVDGPLSLFEEGALLEIARAAEPIQMEAQRCYASGWEAACGTDPRAVELVRERGRSEDLSSLAAALGRWLQELPSAENGLSITQLQILDAVRLGVDAPRPLFEAVEATEALPFRIDWEFWSLVDGLCATDDPLLETVSGDAFLCPPRDLAFDAFEAQRLRVSERGRALLEGRGNYLSGPFAERWLGGLKIDAESPYFWDYAAGKVIDATTAETA